MSESGDRLANRSPSCDLDDPAKAMRFDFERLDEVPERFRVLKNRAHRLAVLAIQSGRYAEDGEFRTAVDGVLDITLRYQLCPSPPNLEDHEK